MNLDDVRWKELHGGYRTPYDPRSALRKLERGEEVDDAWEELWNELHHQGDVGHASYATVEHLVRIHAMRGGSNWNTYALIATIEEARRDKRNPEIPLDIREGYAAAWRDLVDMGLAELRTAGDPVLVSSIIGVIAISKAQFTLGRFAVSFSEDERRELLTRT